MMTIFASLGFAIIMLCSTIAIPAQARSDWNQAAPHWLDQTIYQPHYLLAVCDCGCQSRRLCLPDCVDW
jgi:hypothetical protein